MRRWSVLAPVALLFLVSCGSSGGGYGGGGSAATEPPSATSPPGDPTPSVGAGSEEPRDEPPHEVPDELRFTAPRLGGGMIDGAGYAGKDLVIWFWAPW